MDTMLLDNAATTRPTHHRYATVNGRRVFYRKVGDLASPTIILLHGLPTSSQMFRNLIPALSDRFHLIAPTTSASAIRTPRPTPSSNTPSTT